jgi:hypothetical protein
LIAFLAYTRAAFLQKRLSAKDQRGEKNVYGECKHKKAHTMNVHTFRIRDLFMFFLLPVINSLKMRLTIKIILATPTFERSLSLRRFNSWEDTQEAFYSRVCVCLEKLN